MSALVDFAQLLGFSPAWFSLGVVDDSILSQLQAEWNTGEDNNTEHYRYWAFREFLAHHRPLSPHLAESLYALGEADADQAMGGSMMADIVRLPECPKSVVDAAMNSGLKFLVRIVEQRQS